MTQSNISGYTGKPKTGSKKTQPKPHKTPLEKKPMQEKLIKNSKKSENKDGEKEIKTPKPRIGESKLQWRQQTKKSQRSFSKNKERARLEIDSKDEKTMSSTYSAKKPYSKPSTGFAKAKGGWDKEKPLKKITRNWEIPGEASVDHHKGDSSKTISKKSPKSSGSDPKKIKHQFPVPSWEKELKKIDKKDLIDPTMI